MEENKIQFCFRRRPSWTDRILYKMNTKAYGDNSLKVVQLNYKSHPSYLQSDHKPVTAEFNINVSYFDIYLQSILYFVILKT